MRFPCKRDYRFSSKAQLLSRLQLGSFRPTPRAFWLRLNRPRERLATFGGLGVGLIPDFHLTVSLHALEGAGAADDVPRATQGQGCWGWARAEADPQAAVGALNRSVHEPNGGVLRVRVLERPVGAERRVADGGSVEDLRRLTLDPTFSSAALIFTCVSITISSPACPASVEMSLSAAAVVAASLSSPSSPPQAAIPSVASASANASQRTRCDDLASL